MPSPAPSRIPAAALPSVRPRSLRRSTMPACPTGPKPISSTPAVVAIGVSTGGPAALDVLLPALPANFPLPVLIVQHMPELFTRLFAERLNGRCRLRVREAAEGDPVRAGTIYIARGNWHMEVLAGFAHRPAAHAAPEPGPAGESLPPRRRCALSLRGRGLRLGRAGRGAHRHGLGRHARLPHDPRAGRQRAGPGPGHQHGVGNARRRRQCGTGAQGAAPQRHRS